MTPCRRHDHQVWIEATDEWECQKCGTRTPEPERSPGSDSTTRPTVYLPSGHLLPDPGDLSPLAVPD